MLERIHFEIIQKLHETGSLTKAAEELNLTQSALTHSIKKLERLFNVCIWNKTGRQLKLTQTGLFLLQKAAYILPQFEYAEQQLQVFSAGKKGILRVGVECHPCFEWLVGAVRSFLDNWPDVDLEVTRNFQFDGLEAITHHQVDLVVSPDFKTQAGLLYFEMIDFELQLVVPNNHSFTKNKYIEPRELKDQRLYSYPIPRHRLDVFSTFLTPSGVEPLEHITVETSEIMMQLVSAGRGVSTFPDWLIQKNNKKYGVKGVSLGKKGIKKKLYIIIREDDEFVPYIRDFIDSVQGRRVMQK